MALSQFMSFGAFGERVEAIALRMKEIIETTWLRDTDFNDQEVEEFQRLIQKLENMGFFVIWRATVDFDDKGNLKRTAEIFVVQSRNTTTH